MSNFFTEPFVSAGEMKFPSEPYITAQPQNHTAWGIEDYVLTVIAAGAVSYQWEVFDGESWSTITGATSENLAITIDPSMNGWRYRVLVTGADGSTVVSKAAQIAVRGVHEITLEGAIVTFTGPAMITSLEADINAVQSGSGDPSPTNICPISGWDVVTVFVRGINQWDEEWVNGYINDSGTFVSRSDIVGSKNPIAVKPNTTYYFVASVTGMFVTYWGKDNAFISRYQVPNTKTFTTPSNCYYVQFNLPAAYGNTYNNDISINYPSTDHDYHAYNGTTHPITLPSTVYGGTLDVTSGVLTVTHELWTISPSDWNAGSTDLNINKTVPTKYRVSQTLMCDVFKGIVPRSVAYMHAGEIALSTSFQNINAVFATKAERDAWLEGSTDTNLVMQLATPTTIQLTPTEISALTGVNNIWADSGDIQVTIIR